MDFTPRNLNVSEKDLAHAKKIIDADEGLIVRYTRKDRTVHYAKVPVRDEHGTILKDEDGKWLTKPKLVICAGIPTGVMVAIKVGHALRIGWSRRLDEQTLVDTDNLHTMFRNVVANVQGVDINPSEDDEAGLAAYESHFRAFCGTIMQTLSAPTKDVEIGFSKKAGREAAVLRALLDDVVVHKRFMQSTCSGPIPNEIARGLKWFVPQAEEALGLRAENYGPPSESAGKELTTSNGNAMVAV